MKLISKANLYFCRGTFYILTIQLALFIANTLLLLVGARNNLFSFLTLTPKLTLANNSWWQVLTYSFIHSSLFGAIGSFFFIYFVGGYLEKVIGTSKYLKLYFISNTIPALLAFFLCKNANLNGSFAFIIALIILSLKIWSDIPKLKIVIISALALFSLIIVLNRETLWYFIYYSSPISLPILGLIPIKINFFQRLSEDKERKRRIEISLLERQIEPILEKISKVGYDKLTKDEVKKLHRISKLYKRKLAKDKIDAVKKQLIVPGEDKIQKYSDRK